MNKSSIKSFFGGPLKEDLFAVLFGILILDVQTFKFKFFNSKPRSEIDLDKLLAVVTSVINRAVKKPIANRCHVKTFNLKPRTSIIIQI